MAHQFLSDDWLEAVAVVRDKYAGQVAAFPHTVRMNQVITDAPFADGEDLHISMDTSDGVMRLAKGHLEAPDLTLTTDWETARKIFVDQDQAAGMQAFMSGKIKVQGDMMKMMQMQATPPDELTKQIANEIKDLTA